MFCCVSALCVFRGALSGHGYVQPEHGEERAHDPYRGGWGVVVAVLVYGDIPREERDVE